ncbi:hypothetical protein CW713_07075 [Methanophagales archaeon]|nr:MAG: hypothetical protein CW713_07075 [Methanophagales archaeon]
MGRKHLFGILYVCLTVSVLAEVVNFHGHDLWQTIPGFSALYGFIGCIFIIAASKALGHYWLQKEEDYYE